MGTLIETADWWTKIRRDQLAIVTQWDKVTYGELGRWSTCLAEWLIAEGVEPGDRVVIFATNSLQWCVLSQAIVRAGVILAPLNPRYTVSEASYLVGQVEPKIVFYDGAREPAAQELAQQFPKVRLQALSEVDAFRKRPVSGSAKPAVTPDATVIIMPTSGSTARPKGVMLTHKTMMSFFLEFSLAEPQAVDHAKVLLFAPLCTSAGYVLLTQFLAYGGTLYFDDAFDPARALRRIREDKITALLGAPIFFERIAANDGFTDTDFSSLRFVSVGGARISRQLLETYMAKGVLMRQIYGQTEAGGQSTVNTLEAAVRNPEKCGCGMPFTRIGIIDSNGKFCGPNISGEIVIRGPGVMVGYWRDPEATAKALVDGWLRTGDLGVIDEDGLLTMLDRIKDIIISGGLNISAAELERVISEFAGVDEVAVIAARDEKFGETPLAVIYSAGAVPVADLIAHCCKHLSDYKVPRYAVVEPEPLPRLATGKISKPALRTKYADAHLRLTRVR